MGRVAGISGFRRLHFVPRSLTCRPRALPAAHLLRRALHAVPRPLRLLHGRPPGAPLRRRRRRLFLHQFSHKPRRGGHSRRHVHHGQLWPRAAGRRFRRLGRGGGSGGGFHYIDNSSVAVVGGLGIAASLPVSPPFSQNIGTICRDSRSGSINIHEKREKNPSEKPEVAQPPRVFHEDFS